MASTRSLLALLVGFLLAGTTFAQSTSPLTGTKGTLNLDGNASSEYGVLAPNSTQRNLRILFGDKTATAPGSTYLAIGPTLTTEPDYLRILSSGDVGFGTNTPKARFHAEFENGTAFLLTRKANNGELALSTNAIDNASIGFDAHYDTTSAGTWLPATGATTAAILVKNGNLLRIDRWDTGVGTKTGGGVNTTVAIMTIDLATGFTQFTQPLGIGKAASAGLLDVGGTIHSDGIIAAGTNITAGGNISAGGDITATGAIFASYSQDVAEWVPSTEPLAVGTVVVLDKRAKNHVQASTTAYDASVAGVISGKPGIILGRQAAGDAAVATTGRVPVKVDASRAPIGIGDLLVTSDLPGVAMKSVPIDVNGRSFHQPGTIIGKALEPLDHGTGEILVLLSLQ
jgi:hypothetical protein